MTIPLDWLSLRRAPRGRPRRRGLPRRLSALGLIAGLALLQAGCQSGPFSNCRSCNSCGFLQRTTGRLFNHPSGCCGSSGSGVEYSSPSTVVGPTTSGPLYSPGIGPGTVPSTVSPPADGGTTILEPAPSAAPGKPVGSAPTSGSGATRSSYVTRPAATRTASRPESRPATGRASMPRPSTDESSEPARGGDDDNPLDHLPPLALPGEVTQAASASPTPSASRPEGQAGGDAADRAGSATPPADGVSLSTTEPAGDVAPTDATGTGIARFAPVDPKLAGGSVPTARGLAWLAEKGYRTILDLRPSGEVSPGFLSEVAARGLRYVALPVEIEKLDAERLARFQFELAAQEARPLFFFDSDGSRAGALWYIRRVTIDHVDAEIAHREAEEIGLKAASAWRVTTGYVDRIESARARPSSTRTDAANPPAPPSATTERASTEGAREEAIDLPQAQNPFLSTHAPAAGAARVASSNQPVQLPVDPPVPLPPSGYWRPFAAMLLTGLSLPLAYWTRTAIPDAIARARASLPAPGPRPRSLPNASGE